ncbi:MAG: cation transporter, partial [Acidimicrobiaceae bacterium]|nr:cation transporter [Acidimicrobiaceae bacterium]
RVRLLARAIRLSIISVAWGLVSGVLAVVAGINAGSLGVLGLGLNILADVTGSLGLIWRFRVEQRDPFRANHAERLASLVVGTALVTVSLSLAVAATTALISRTSPHQSWIALGAAGVSTIVLTPLGLAKRRTGQELASHALRGDGTLSIIGSALGLVAVMGLLANEYLGWWWTDRGAALGIAVVAGVEAARVLRNRPRAQT